MELTTRIAKFESRGGARKPDPYFEYNSILFVCWFTHRINDNLNEEMKNVLSLVNWEEYAEGYDICDL
ncbi:hypothetical protein METHB2_1180004 [Candidatus Methylobacter favarea]|uniref:Uncharacterized protein n=1 Tax=Candidatus Methylobacter favarea TaxID=2707345 RepID=A0A8S0XQZ2_9GAMM|nr:hypothetical protein METHB2_1180004 [Candidatus Methylobacter favarea]